jgi:hypothetical protein
MTCCNCTFSVLLKSGNKECEFLRIVLPFKDSETVKFLTIVRLDNLRAKTEMR